MSWAMRRRILYLLGVLVFLLLVIGGPLAIVLRKPPTCFDGAQNQGETAIDKGGPCLLLDERLLAPYAPLWTRAFQVRDGSYDVTTYIQNPNDTAGVAQAQYRIGLYDSDNVLVAERRGSTFIMPGGITPVFLGSVDTGNRSVVRAYFQFTNEPLQWERMSNVASAVTVSNKTVTDTDAMPRISADVKNTSVAPIQDLTFVIVVFDPAGNAFASSQTALTRLNPNETRNIVFTWPKPFTTQIGRIDITPIHPPAYPKQ